MRQRAGMAAVLSAAVLLMVMVPLGLALAGAMLAPRAWAGRARWREEHGYRRVVARLHALGEERAPAGMADRGTEVVVRPLSRGRSLLVASVGLGAAPEARYGIAVEVGGAGALVLEGTGGAQELALRAAARWEADEAKRAERRSGEASEEVARWLEDAGVPGAVAGDVARDAAQGAGR